MGELVILLMDYPSYATKFSLYAVNTMSYVITGPLIIPIASNYAISYMTTTNYQIPTTTSSNIYYVTIPNSYTHASSYGTYHTHSVYPS